MSSNGVIFAALLYYAICIVALFVIPVNRKPSSAIAWLMLIVGLPYLGVVLFLLLGSPKLTKRRRARQHTVDELIKRSVAEAKQQPELAPIFDATIPELYLPLVELNANLGGMPAFTANTVDLLPASHRAVERIVAAIEGPQKHVARSTATVTLSALKFLFEHTLRQPFPILDLLRPRPTQALPVVLSVDEVWHILAQLRLARYRVCLSTIYTCGLRVHEGAQLRVAEIDSARMQLHIQASKGNKERYVPLPPRTLTLLRGYWVTHRNPIWLFPAAGPGGVAPLAATRPSSRNRASTSRRPCIRCGIRGRPTCSKPA